MSRYVRKLMACFYKHLKTLIVVLLIFYLGYIPNLNCQTDYKVTYYVSKPKLQGSIDNLDEKGKLLTKEIFARASQLNYILLVNQDESYFSLEDVLRKENDSPIDLVYSRMAKRYASFNEKIYINYKKDSIVFVKNLLNKDFIVKRECFDFNWVIREETKKILGFDVMKAEGTYFYPVTNEELKVVAWFIPSIPLQSGPDIFMGLPGLIAEVDLKGAIVTVKKIETNKNIEVDKIDDTKAMTQKEYEDLIVRLTKKFIDD